MRFLTIIELPKTAYRIVETPSAGERLMRLLTWGLTGLALALIALGSALVAFSQKRAAWARGQAARYRLVSVIAGVFISVALEEALFVLFCPLAPAIPAAG